MEAGVLEPVRVVALRSLWISGTATLLASSWSVPLALVLSSSSRGRRALALLEALVGVPTVLVGLLVYLLLSRSGPLGFLGLLYTPTAIILGESILVTPLIVAYAARSIAPSAAGIRLLAQTLGAGRGDTLALIAWESLPAITGAVVTGFSRAIGEVGVALVAGGSIKGYTRTLTTSIALATSMGMYGEAIRLGLVLTLLSIGVSLGARVVEAWLARK